MSARNLRGMIFDITLIALASILAIWLYFSSPVGGLSNQAQKTLSVTVLALGLWAAFPQKAFWPSILVIALLFLTQLALSIEQLGTMTLGVYGESGLWTVIAGFIIAHALDVSGLSKRIALGIVSKFGGNARKVILSIAIANFAIAPLSPSTTAKAFLILPICISIAEAFKSEKGVSNFGKSLFLMSAAANNICASMFLNATVPNSISRGYLGGLGEVSWLTWFVYAFPPNIILLLASWLIITRLYRPEVDVVEGGVDSVKKMRKELGPMKHGEWVSLTVFLTALILWVLEPLYTSLIKPTGLNGGLISLILCVILFVPRIGVIKLGRFGRSVPWGPIALFAAAMYLAAAIQNTKAFDPLVSDLFARLGISTLPLVPTLIVVVFLSIFLHIFFTSTTAYATVVLPVVIAVATAGHLPPLALALPVAITMAYAFILPMNTIPNVVMLQPGYFKQKNMALYGLILSLTATLLILLVGMPYWILVSGGQLGY